MWRIRIIPKLWFYFILFTWFWVDLHVLRAFVSIRLLRDWILQARRYFWNSRTVAKFCIKCDSLRELARSCTFSVANYPEISGPFLPLLEELPMRLYKTVRRYLLVSIKLSSKLNVWLLSSFEILYCVILYIYTVNLVVWRKISRIFFRLQNCCRILVKCGNFRYLVTSRASLCGSLSKKLPSLLDNSRTFTERLFKLSKESE